MTKDEELKYNLWIIILFADIWVASWFLFEKCTIKDWWTLPSLVTFGAVGAVALLHVLDRIIK